MPNSPVKRARKQGVSRADGSIMAFPYIPRVADLPPALTGLDPLRLSMKLQVICIVFQICAKAMFDGSLAREAAGERERPRRLARLMQKLPPEHRPPQKP